MYLARFIGTYLEPLSNLTRSRARPTPLICRSMAELKALFPDWYDEEIPFSCGHVVSVPGSYGENRFSVEEF